VVAVDAATGVISPHLDDAVLSCGGYMAAHRPALMVTVFAGGPPAVEPLPDWDVDAGVFEPGDDVVGTRRAEDRQAARQVGASTLHLDHWDFQYRTSLYGYGGPEGEELVERVAASLESVVTSQVVHRWLIPLGILHPDHQVTAAACLDVAYRLPDVEWILYEDLPYAVAFPDERRRALMEVERRRLAVGEAPEAGPSDPAAKAAAVACYRSQLEPLGGAVGLSLATPERLGRLGRR
jgi:LmbE family N-acetylglucosaminyl deacetylase